MTVTFSETPKHRFACYRLTYEESKAPDRIARIKADLALKGKVAITIEVDAELLAQVTEVLKPYDLTPEDAVVKFFEYCADPKTQDHAIELLKKWKKELELPEKDDPNDK